MGIYVEGLFLEYRQYTNEDGTVSLAVSVACGRSAYNIFLDEKQDTGVILALEVGDKVKFRARPYVNKKGCLAWSDGELIDA